MNPNILKAIFCLSVVLVLGAVSVGYVEAQEDQCEALKLELTGYLEKEALLQEELYDLVNLGVQDVDVVHSQLLKYIGKSLGDVSAEVQKVQMVASLLSDQGDALFEFADEAEDRSYDWLDTYSSCGWDEKAVLLEEWQVANYENLSTIASFLGGYATIMSKWPANWEKLQERASEIDESSFDEVEEIGKGLEESLELMSDTFEYTKEAFEAARP